MLSLAPSVGWVFEARRGSAFLRADRREGEDEESPRPPVSKTAAESPQEETLSSSPKYREVVPAQRSSQDREPAPCGEEVSSSGEDALPPRGGGAPASVLRMGVDLPLSPQDGVLWFQCQRIAAIENLDKVNGLKVRPARLRSGLSFSESLRSSFLSFNKRLAACALQTPFQGLHIVSGEVRSLEGLECQSETLEELEIYQNQLKKIDLVSTLKNLRSLADGACRLVATSFPRNDRIGLPPPLWCSSEPSTCLSTKSRALKTSSPSCTLSLCF